MEKLRWLEIKNYRGIKQARLEDFGDINIIIGKNNTGKSTILESIYLNITSQDLDLVGNDPLLFIFRRRGTSGISTPQRNLDIDELFHYLGYIFHREDFEKSVKLMSNLKEYELRIIKDEEIPENLFEFVISYITKRRKLFPKIEVGELLFIVVDNLQRPLIVAFEEIKGEEIRYNIRFVSHRFYVDNTLKRRKRNSVILVDTHWLFLL